MVKGHFINRQTPSKGVRISLHDSNWVFLTVCTRGRSPWLANEVARRALHEIWLHHATTRLVSDYLLMPDHLHLFCAPYDLSFQIERWIAFWKYRTTKVLGEYGAFQRGGFHHRLRTSESYAEKWQYVRENPVRASLVANHDDWPYQGKVHEIHW